MVCTGQRLFSFLSFSYRLFLPVDRFMCSHRSGRGARDLVTSQARAIDQSECEVRGGTVRCEGSSQELMPCSIVQCLEKLKILLAM